MVRTHFTINFNLRALNELFEIAHRNVKDQTAEMKLAMLSEKIHHSVIDHIMLNSDKFNEEFINSLIQMFDLEADGNKETDMGCNLADS